MTRSIRDELANDNLPLNFILNEKQIVDLYLTVDNNLRYVSEFIEKHFASGVMTRAEADAAILLGRESAETVMSQITSQYPQIAARSAQIRAYLKDQGIIE